MLHEIRRISAAVNEVYIMNTDNRPIGVLDSGLGGISVLRELVKLMPGEDFHLFRFVRIPHVDAQKEPVHLRLGQWISSHQFHRVLGGQDHKGSGKLIGFAVDADLSLLHGLQ